MKMTRQNIFAAAVVLGLAAAAATPALAFENEFHGSFTAQFVNSNFNRTVSTDYSAAADGYYNPQLEPKKRSAANFVEQRARLLYTAKADNDLKLVTAFEIDYAYWGNSSYDEARNAGGAIGADSVNIETKSLYLDFNPAKSTNVKLGMMPNTDAFKGVIFDTDMAGGLASVDMGKFTPTIGLYRFSDSSETDGAKKLGKFTSDMVMLDAKFAASENLKLGGAYYLFLDNTGANDVKMNVLGINAAYVMGDLTISGFGVYETGKIDGESVNSYALNAGAAVKLGPGTFRAETLYVQGSDDGKHAFYSVAGEHGFYNNEMVMLGRDKNAMTTDNSMIYNAGNEGQGQVGLYLGYDLPVNDKLATAFNIGGASVVKNNSNDNGKYLGTEINAEATYTVLKGLTAGVRAGYVFLGDYYKNVALNNETPVNPYDLKLMVKYTF